MAQGNLSMRLRSGAAASAPVMRRHRPDVLLVLFVSVLLLLGLVVIYAISPPLIARLTASGQELTQHHFMYRQLLYLGAGIAAFITTALIPIDFWRTFAGKLLLGGVIVAILPFVLQATPIGLCANDACRWLNLGFTSFQPAEALKFTLVVFLASFLAVRIGQGKLNDLHHTLIPVSIILIVIAIIVIVLQKDLGTGATIFAIVMTIVFVAGLKQRLLMAVVALSIALAGIFTIIAPHRVERVLTFINHSSVQEDTMGYHINQALIAIGSGGFTGKGLGQSIQAFGYLPEASNDSIFAILAEKFGFLGTIAVLAIFAGLFLRIAKVAERSTNTYYKLICAGVLGWIFSHTAVNIGAMLGIFPLTGITLPFVSFGGTSLLFMLAALGLVFQISRYTSHQPPAIDHERGGSYDDNRRRRGFGRSHNA